MNLIEESFQNKEEKKKKRTTGIILGAIIFVIIIIIAIVSYLLYIESTTMKLILDGQSNESLKQIIIFENGKMYAPIKEIAGYLGYSSYNGEYSQRSEDKSKCYVQSENEVANFYLNSNTIYKLDLTTSNNNYEVINAEEPVISKDGILYASSAAIEKAFNVSFTYDQNTNRINIYTLPYLYQTYSVKVLDYGYTEISDVFANQKAMLQNMLVVKTGQNNNVYGVIDVNGNVILEAKYDSITYLPEIGDFKVGADRKVGIMGTKGEIKVQIMYDSIELMDSNAGLYVVSNDKKYGVIDTRGNIRIYVENDEVGMDITPFAQNNLKSKYILVDNLIPVRKDELWALYDLSGNQVVDFTYDSFGYIARSNRDALNLLVIPDYEVLVACKNEKYVLLNSVGQQLFAGPVADDIYMTISGGETHYYIIANNQTIDAEEYLDGIGVRKRSEGGTVNSTININTNMNNNTNNNTNNENVTNNNETNNNEINNTTDNANSVSGENNQVNNEEQVNENNQNGEVVEPEPQVQEGMQEQNPEQVNNGEQL